MEVPAPHCGPSSRAQPFPYLPQRVSARLLRLNRWTWPEVSPTSKEAVTEPNPATVSSSSCSSADRTHATAPHGGAVSLAPDALAFILRERGRQPRRPPQQYPGKASQSGRSVKCCGEDIGIFESNMVKTDQFPPSDRSNIDHAVIRLNPDSAK
jgi:hypothetical protein